MAGNMLPHDSDLVELMRLSLADEQKVREQTSTQLQAAQAEIQSKGQNLASSRRPGRRSSPR